MYCVTGLTNIDQVYR